MYTRSLLPSLRDTLDDTPVLLVQGARQTGKTTLVEALSQELDATYQSLDDTTTLAAIRADPGAFLAAHATRTLILDEVQRLPELFLPMKVEVDRGRRPGRFLLTGSANVLSLPRLSESLAGRMQILTLWPLSQGEIQGTAEHFVDRVLSRDQQWITAGTAPAVDVLAAALQGGFPDRIGKTLAQNRNWYRGYLTTVLERDVRDISEIQAPDDLVRLLSLIATRTGSLLNYSDLSRGLGMIDSTLKRYFALLEKVFLVRRLPAWAVSLDKRVTKSPKVYLLDTGLLAYLLDLDVDRLSFDRTPAGPLIENMVYMELVKQIGWSQTQPAIYHFRTPKRHEVDFVLERRSGEIAGIEVKATSGIGAKHFEGLEALRDAAGDRFLRGVVLYSGQEIVPFGEKLWAVPIQSLWLNA